MSTKWINLVLAFALTLTPGAAFADHDKDQGHGHGYGHDKDRDGQDGDRGRGHEKEKHGEKAERHYYREHDRELHEWYRAHYNRLPPGLAQRDRLPPGLERQLVVRGTLPPGLQKKMRPCPDELEQFLPPPPVGYVHTVIGGNIVLVNRRTLFVIDVFHFEM
jgi:Ni/Co efflux regulator RcnB